MLFYKLQFNNIIKLLNLIYVDFRGHPWQF